MIAARRLQRSFADGLIAEEVGDLWEPWMRQADQVLEDEYLLNDPGIVDGRTEVGGRDETAAPKHF
jgi:hypothetical protein